MTTTNAQALLRLLQLTSPALPVGAYSYSEGLETLVEQGIMTTATALGKWLEQELSYGLVVMDGVAVELAFRSATQAGVGPGDGTPGVASDEGHEEPKADQHHHVYILEGGVALGVQGCAGSQVYPHKSTNKSYQGNLYDKHE